MYKHEKHKHKENLIKELEEGEVIGHRHPEHFEEEEFAEHGEIKHRRVKFGRLSIRKFNG